jgi:hypothetical protein
MEETKLLCRLIREINLERKTRMTIKKSIGIGVYLLAAVVALASARAAFAGGFRINIEAPNSSDAELKGAALLVRTDGCHQPWDADVSATAEGMVDGKRQSLKLELSRTSRGVYAIKKQWASKGVWVIAITGRYNGITSSALVEMGSNGTVRISRDNRVAARTVQRTLTSQDIDAALNSLSNKAS